MQHCVLKYNKYTETKSSKVQVSSNLYLAICNIHISTRTSTPMSAVALGTQMAHKLVYVTITQHKIIVHVYSITGREVAGEIITYTIPTMCVDILTKKFGKTLSIKNHW